MRLPSLSSRAIIAALHRAGFREAPDRGRGSHRAFVKTDATGRVRLVIVPHGKDIPRGTMLSILDQAGLTRDEFLRLL
jgi:predicted RNA binding protein YcfA (HicA-like mRNA interferase family)